MSELASQFPQGRPIYSIFSPGLDGRSEPCGSVEELSSRFVEIVRSVQPRGPYLLAGHSFGGLIVFEIALRLSAAGERVAFVGILDKQAPGSLLGPWLNPIDSLATVYRFTRWAVGGFFTAQSRTRHAAEIVASTSSFFRSTLSLMARRLGFESRSRGGEGSDPVGDLPAHLSRTVAANLRADMLYRPRVYAGQVFLYRTPRCVPRFRPAAPRDLGWRRYVRNGVIVRMLEGDHFTFVRNPRAAALASLIAADLAGAESEGVECGC
jgi:acetoacetyl-CoA synthetase